MGNTLAPFHPPQRTLRVYCDKGRVLQFTKSVPAVKLMRDHPRHLLVSGVVKPKQGRPGEARRPPKDHVRIRVVRPGDVLQVGQSYFMVHIPEQYTSRFAKYFHPQSPAASARSKYSLYASPKAVFNSGCTSPLILFTTPPGSPQRAQHGRTTSSPLSMYIPSPLNGSTRDKMRHPDQQPLRNSTNLSGVQRPGRTTTPRSIRDLISGDSDESPQRNSTNSKGIESSGRPSASTERVRSTLGQHLQENPADSNRNQFPARPATTPVAHDRVRKDVSQHFRQTPDRCIQSPSRRPGTPVTHDSIRRALSQHYQQNPSRLMRSPGRPMLPSHDMTRSFYPLKGSSPCHSKRSPQRSPRRSIKFCQGKPGSRPRRVGMRSPHHKGALMRSPGRTVRPIAVTDNVCVPCFPLFDSRETTKKPKTIRASPGPSFSFSVTNVRTPLLIRRSSLSRSGHWAPALESISEV